MNHKKQPSFQGNYNTKGRGKTIKRKEDKAIACSKKYLKRRYLEATHSFVEEFQAPMYLRELINGANVQMKLSV